MGRIENGQAIDNTWLNREKTNGSNYQDLTSLGGKATIGSGQTSAYIPQAFYDGGVLMRGCGKAGNRTTIVCTGWY